MRTRMSRTIALSLPAIVLALGLASCAGGPAATESSTAGGGTQDFDTIYDAYHVKYASCMREEGIDYPDPKPGNAISNDEGSVVASDACIEKLGKPPVPARSEQETEKQVTELLERAKCLREQGYDVPDPKPDGTWSLPESLHDAARACATTE